MVLVIPHIQYQYRDTRFRGSTMPSEYASHSLHPINRQSVPNCSKPTRSKKKYLVRARETMRNSTATIKAVRPPRKTTPQSVQVGVLGVLRAIIHKPLGASKTPIAPKTN